MRSLLLIYSTIYVTFFSGLLHAQSSVTIKHLSSLTYYPEYRFSAEVKAQSESLISSEVSANLTHLPISLGDTVLKGQLLAEFDCRDYEDKLALNKSSQKELQANLDLARLQYKRLSELNERQLAADSAKDEAFASKQALMAKLASSKIQSKFTVREISRCKIHAPYDGVVMEKRVGIGQWLNPGTPMLQLARLDGMEVEVKLPLGYSTTQVLSSAQWLAEDGSRYDLQWLRSARALNPQSKMRPVWFSAPESLLLGQQGTVVVRGRKALLPAEFVVRRGGHLGIFVAEKGRARFQMLANAETGRPVLLEGISGNPRIVVDGQQSLQDGDRLK